MAASDNKVDVLKLLHNLGVSLNTPADDGLKPAQVAKKNGHKEALCFLRELEPPQESSLSRASMIGFFKKYICCNASNPVEQNAHSMN